MSTSFTHIAYTEKEKISQLIYPKKDVLSNSILIQKRLQSIDQAIDAGNFAQFKVMIIFEDNKEIKEVETTIWERDAENIYLKNDVSIPIHRIHKLSFS